MRICLGKEFRGCLLDKRALGSSFIHKSASTGWKENRPEVSEPTELPVRCEDSGADKSLSNDVT